MRTAATLALINLATFIAMAALHSNLTHNFHEGQARHFLHINANSIYFDLNRAISHSLRNQFRGDFIGVKIRRSNDVLLNYNRDMDVWVVPGSIELSLDGGPGQRKPGFVTIEFIYNRLNDVESTIWSWLMFAALSLPVGLLVHTSSNRRREKELELKKSKTLSSAAAMLAHDLRTPLETLGSYIKNKHDEQIEPSSGKSVKRAERALHRIQTLIQALRRSEADLIVQKQSCQLELKELVDEVSATTSEASMHLMLPENWHELTLSIDSGKLERALLNLLRNAVESGADQIIVEASTNEHDLLIRVCDNGPGIAVEHRKRMFQRGFTHGKQDGTGLGLSFVQEVIRGHEGDVTYKRQTGESLQSTVFLQLEPPQAYWSVFQVELPDSVWVEHENSGTSMATKESHAYSNTQNAEPKNLNVPRGYKDLDGDVRKGRLANGADARVKQLVFIDISDPSRAQAIATGLADRFAIATTTDESNMEKACVVYSDHHRLIARAVKQGSLHVLDNKSDSVEQAIHRLHQKVKSYKGLQQSK